MQVNLEISAERIADLMTTAIESGDPVTTAARGGWCSGIYWRTPRATPPLAGKDPWYARVSYWGGDFQITIVEVDDEVTGHKTEHVVGKNEFQRGLQVMAQKFPDAFGQIMANDIDAGCADLFLQCMLFGEERYA